MERITAEMQKATTRSENSSQLIVQSQKNTGLRVLNLSEAVARMCLNRGEAMDRIRSTEYAEAMAERFADSDSLAWMKSYGMARREDFEARIPSLGDALDMIDRVAKRRVWDETREERAAAEIDRRAELERKFEEEREAAYQARKANPQPKHERMVPRYPAEPVRASGEPWERLGVSQAAYAADCERKRGLIERVNEGIVGDGEDD